VPNEIGFAMQPLWGGYEVFLVYHLTMGGALSMIPGRDVAFLYESHRAGGAGSRGAAVFALVTLPLILREPAPTPA
jgi:hypothetical protein